MRTDTTELTYETMLTDPLIRLVMESDGVSVAELDAVLCRVAGCGGRWMQAPARPPLSLVEPAYLALPGAAPCELCASCD